MHHIIVKTNLFLVSGITYRLLGSYELKDLGGVYRQRPYLALLFLIPALSLAGIPPLSGFFAKFVVVRATLESSEYLVAAVALWPRLRQPQPRLEGVELRGRGAALRTHKLRC